eukprot:87090_1
MTQVWERYVNHFGYEPQTSSQLQKFSATTIGGGIKISFKQCRETFNKLKGTFKKLFYRLDYDSNELLVSGYIHNINPLTPKDIILLCLSFFHANVKWLYINCGKIYKMLNIESKQQYNIQINTFKLTSNTHNIYNRRVSNPSNKPYLFHLKKTSKLFQFLIPKTLSKNAVNATKSEQYLDQFDKYTQFQCLLSNDLLWFWPLLLSEGKKDLINCYSVNIPPINNSVNRFCQPIMHSYSKSKDCLIQIGGLWVNSINILNSNGWKSYFNHLQYDVRLSGLCLINNDKKLLVMGGIIGNDIESIDNVSDCVQLIDLDALNVDTKCNLVSSMQQKRYEFVCATDDIFVYVGCGYKWDMNKNMNLASKRVEYYDLNKDKWMYLGNETNETHLFDNLLWIDRENPNIIYIGGDTLGFDDNYTGYEWHPDDFKDIISSSESEQDDDDNDDHDDNDDGNSKNYKNNLSDNFAYYEKKYTVKMCGKGHLEYIDKRDHIQTWKLWNNTAIKQLFHYEKDDNKQICI